MWIPAGQSAASATAIAAADGLAGLPLPFGAVGAVLRKVLVSCEQARENREEVGQFWLYFMGLTPVLQKLGAIFQQRGAPAPPACDQVVLHLTQLLTLMQEYEGEGSLGQAAGAGNFTKNTKFVQRQLDAAMQALQLHFAADSGGKIDEILHQKQSRDAHSERVHQRDHTTIALETSFTDFEIFEEQELGRGSHGRVCKAIFMGETVAAKVIPLHGKSSERAKIVEGVTREVSVMYGLRSPRILQVMGMHEDGQRIIILMEIAEGGSLRTALDRGSITSTEQKARILLDGALGMKFLHSKRILHRDFKADNLLLSGNSRAKVADFGLSKETGVSTSTSGMQGTVAYAAPEFLDGQPYTQACDVYSFAVVMWETMTGKVPWAGKGQMQLLNAIAKGDRLDFPPGFPAPLRELTKRCWAQLATERPTFGEIERELQQFLSTVPTAPLASSSSIPAPASATQVRTARSSNPAKYTVGQPAQVADPSICGWYVVQIIFNNGSSGPGLIVLSPDPPGPGDNDEDPDKFTTTNFVLGSS
jgi:serine/threonine protein kinase